MVIIECDSGLHELVAAEGMFLHRKGSDVFTPVRRVMVTDPQAWEEVPEDAGAVAAREAVYGAEVARLVAERYSVAQELALINNAMAGGDEAHAAEYAAYQAYRAECKARARAALEAENEQETVSVPDVEKLEEDDHE